MQFIRPRVRATVLLAFSSVATHNQFCIVRGPAILNRHAPVIDFPEDAPDDHRTGLLGLLNSSVACFWMKQIFHNKGSSVDQHGARQTTIPFENFWEHDGTKLKRFPLPAARPLALTRQLKEVSGLLCEVSAVALLRTRPAEANREVIAERRMQWEGIRQQMIALQEELDWQCYRLYGLIEDELPYRETPPAIALGQRAFEIALARSVAAGEVQTTWFERHGSTPTTEMPADWPDDYKRIVERRIELIETDRNIGLIEQPEYKRRWNTEPWDSQLERALRAFLLDCLERYFDFDGRMNDQTRPTAKLDIALTSVSRLADIARQDADFMQVGEVYRDDSAFNVDRLVAELVEAESVPLLPILRYKPSGLRKRAEWEQTWELQREEDRLDRERESARQCYHAARRRIAEEVGEHFTNLKRKRERLLSMTKRLYAESGQTFVGDDAYEAEIHASVLLTYKGVSRLADAQTLQHLIDEAQHLAWELDRKVDERGKNDAGYQAAVMKLEAIPQKPDIPVPPKYTSADFLKSDYWRLRGKLDVPKERWVSFPHCEGPDGTPVIAWAGYDHLQLARSISSYYVDIQERLGGRNDPRLVPLLACLLELIPWLKQWHNEVDPEFGERMGDYFQGFVNEEARQLGKTIPEIKAWQPEAKTKARGKKAR